MVRKLIKYDFTSYLRLILPVQLILLGIAALSRIVQIFENTKSEVYNIIFISSMVLYVIAILVCLILTTIVAIVRFYQGMYTNEGYLSHTLPVTPAQHLFSKLIVSMLFEIGSVFTVIVSFCIITLGELNIEIFKAGFYILGDFFKILKADGAFYIVEFILFLIIAAVAELLKLYFCISVGQLVSRKKILLAFGVYFGLYILTQVFGTILIVFVTLNPDLMEKIGEWIADNGKLFTHLILCGAMLWSVIRAAVYFLISRFIMSKKLNLT